MHRGANGMWPHRATASSLWKSNNRATKEKGGQPAALRRHFITSSLRHFHNLPRKQIDQVKNSHGQQGCDRNGKYPCPDQFDCYAPAYGAHSFRNANADDATGNCMRGAYRNTGQRGAKQGNGAGGFGTESTYRFQLRDFGSDGVNNAPAAEICARGDGRVGGGSGHAEGVLRDRRPAVRAVR